MKQLVIIGASGHGKVVADLAVKIGYEDIIFLDDNITKKNCSGFPVVGNSSLAEKFKGDVIVAIGNAKVRQQIQERLELEGVSIPVLIHPNAVIGSNVAIGKGTVIMAGAVVNPDTCIGKGCIINTCSSIDHDCKLGDYVHISVGSHLAGAVEVGRRTWVGIGAVVSNNINICCDCMIGAGAVVVRDILVPDTYVGTPAKPIN